MIDRHRRLRCALDDARPHLSGPAAIRSWFGIEAIGHDRRAVAGASTLTLHHVDERWNPSALALTFHADNGDTVIDGYLTIRSIVYAIDEPNLVDGTEIWVHAELASARRDRALERAITTIAERGLEHLALELDTTQPP